MAATGMGYFETISAGRGDQSNASEPSDAWGAVSAVELLSECHEELERIEYALGERVFREGAAGALLALAAEAAFLTETAARALVVKALRRAAAMVEAAASAALPAGKNPVELGCISSERKRAAFCAAMVLGAEPLMRVRARASTTTAGECSRETWSAAAEPLGDFCLRAARSRRLVHLEYQDCGEDPALVRHARLVRVLRSMKKGAIECGAQNREAQSFGAALSRWAIGLPPDSGEGELLEKWVTLALGLDVARKTMGNLMQLAQEPEGRAFFTNAFRNALLERRFRTVAAGSGEGFRGERKAEGGKLFAGKNGSDGRAKLWWAVDGWWLEWPSGAVALAEVFSEAFGPFRESFPIGSQKRTERIFDFMLALDLARKHYSGPVQLANGAFGIAVAFNPQLEAAFMFAAANEAHGPQAESERRAREALSGKPIESASMGSAGAAWPRRLAKSARWASLIRPMPEALGPAVAQESSPSENSSKSRSLFAPAEDDAAEGSAASGSPSSPDAGGNGPQSAPKDSAGGLVGARLLRRSGTPAAVMIERALKRLTKEGMLAASVSARPKGIFVPMRCFEDGVFKQLKSAKPLDTSAAAAPEVILRESEFAPWLWRRVNAWGEIEDGILLRCDRLEFFRVQPNGMENPAACPPGEQIQWLGSVPTEFEPEGGGKRSARGGRE